MTACNVAGCPDPATRRGWCTRHYQRWRKYGDPLRERPGLKTRLLSRVRVHEITGCWEYQGARGVKPFDYGLLKTEGRLEKAHRVSWEVHHGEIPDGFFVLHSCDNPPCCNPGHLMLGTQMANVRDAITKGRRPGRAA